MAIPQLFTVLRLLGGAARRMREPWAPPYGSSNTPSKSTFIRVRLGVLDERRQLEGTRTWGGVRVGWFVCSRHTGTHENAGPGAAALVDSYSGSGRSWIQEMSLPGASLLVSMQFEELVDSQTRITQRLWLEGEEAGAFRDAVRLFETTTPHSLRRIAAVIEKARKASDSRPQP